MVTMHAMERPGIEMFVETENVLTPDGLKRIFICVGIDEFVGEEYGFSGEFPDSNVTFDVFEEEKSTLGAEVIAGNAKRECNWIVGIRVRFRYVNETYEACVADLKAFVLRLASLATARFVLSFQFETIYAIRDGEGLCFVKAL